MTPTILTEQAPAGPADTQELLKAFRDLEAFLGRSPERAEMVKTPWETGQLTQFIDVAVKEKLWLLADHLLVELARRGRLTREQGRLAARVRNFKATMYVQVPQVPADAPMARAIETYVRQTSPKVILDVGAATGLGTTTVFSRAAGAGCAIYAMESEPATFELLKRNTAGLPNVRAVCSALITDEDVPAWEAVLAEIRQRSKLLEQFPEDEIHPWYVHGVALLRQLRQAGKAPFAELPAEIDIAMIDADLFFARQELAAILDRTRLVILDDVCAYKNAWNHEMLAGSKEWEMLDYQPGDRNGWSAFRRK